MRSAITFAAVSMSSAIIAAAAPAAAQTAPVPGPFIAYFGTGSATLDANARKVLDQAVAAFRADSGRMIVLAGHSDVSANGAAAVDESQRRANVVRDYLVAGGIPASAITTQAFGSTRPAVEAPQGKPEPRNRRVEITFGPSSGW